MFLLYFFLETLVGLPDFCPYMYLRREAGLHVIVISNIKTAICGLKRRFGKTSLLAWRLDTINQFKVLGLYKTIR